MSFDPAEDTPSSANLLRVKETYEDLLDAGHEDAANELRETPTVPQQQQAHIRLRKEHLVESTDREIVPDRTFDMTVGSTPEEVQADADAFLEKRAAKKEQLKETLAEKKEHIEQRLSDTNE